MESESLKWLESYISQCQLSVDITGHISIVAILEAGVLQGIILGHLLYTIYTLDFREVFHKVDYPYICEDQNMNLKTLFPECGGICFYADNSTYLVTAVTTAELSLKLEEKFTFMSRYLSENWLCINSDKTHFLVMSTRQKKIKTKEVMATLNTGNEVIHPSRSETILGCKVHKKIVSVNTFWTARTCSLGN